MEEVNIQNDESVPGENGADDPIEKSFEELQKDFDEIKSQAEDYLNGWRRAKADYANLLKEKDKERKEIIEFANAALIAELLPVYSNLKKAVKHADSTLTAVEDANLKNWIEGVKFIKKQWENIFKAVGIEEIKSVGEKFNPEVHEAVKGIEELGVESGESEKIIEEVEPGYTFKGKVIYPAKVVVS